VSALDGRRLLAPETLRAFTTTRARGIDLVHRRESHFGVGFQLCGSHTPMAGAGSFGHDGRGGSLGFGRADLELGFGFSTDRMTAVDGPDEAIAPLVDALLSCPGLSAARRRRPGRG
jgi:hypothetical protein